MRSAYALLVSIILSWPFLFSTPAVAQKISEHISPKLIVNADFRPGGKEKPAVLLLHGFMSTYNINIIQKIANELESNEYTILAPTLSLNISNRSSPGGCDSIHTHSMDSDIEEIRWWLQWLSKRGFSKQILIGHSTGALQLAVLLSKYKLPGIQFAVFAAPAYFGGSPFPKDVEQREIQDAERLLERGSGKLYKYHLSYCKASFTAAPAVFLSYKAWTAEHLISALKKIDVPNKIILAEKDTRFGKHWKEKLTGAGIPVIEIQGANHFFDSPFEFDFLESLLKLLDEAN